MNHVNACIENLYDAMSELSMANTSHLPYCGCALCRSANGIAFTIELLIDRIQDCQTAAAAAAKRKPSRKVAR